MLTDGKKTLDLEYNFHFINNEKIILASCTFTTKHYVVEFNPKTGPAKTEAWFSPDLHAALKTTVTIVQDGVPRTTTLQAMGIALDFKPFQ